MNKIRLKKESSSEGSCSSGSGGYDANFTADIKSLSVLHLSVCASMDIADGWGLRCKQRQLCLHTNATNTYRRQSAQQCKTCYFFCRYDDVHVCETKKPSKLIKRSVVYICPSCDLLKKLWCQCNSSTTLSLPYGTMWHRKVESMKQKIRKRDEEILKRATTNKKRRNMAELPIRGHCVIQ